MTQALTRTPDWLAIWTAARGRLRRDLGAPVFDAWIGKLNLLDFHKGDLKFGAPRPFVRNWVANNYVGRIEKALRAEGGTPASITIVLAPSETPAVGGGLTREDKSLPSSTASVSVLSSHQPHENRREEGQHPGVGVPALFFRAPDPTLTFANFVEGQANALALRASRTFADGEADDVSLLYIHASFGLGKTHLLGALNRKETLGFKDELRAADVLLIDDLQHLCRSTSTMSELLHTLNAYSDLRRKLVIAADRPPHQLEALGPDVRSRLSGGLVIALGKPERDTRLAILRARADEYARKRTQARIPDEALERIADLEDATPRDLIGFFNNLTLHAELTKNPLAFSAAVDTIVRRGAVTRKTSIEDIQRKIADFYKLDPRDFQSAQRSRRVARPRQVAMFLAREITLRSLPEIGRRFGGRDHTTVLHACRRIAALCNEDPTFKQEVDFLKQVLGKEN
jgi:chromosomal replication initiator protein